LAGTSPDLGLACCSAQEITQEYLAKLQAAEPHVQSFISINSEAALATAQALDEKISAGGIDQLGPLAGVPLGVKVPILS
jgi:aspartyl-tRNA(Asn)/glutamyl-tRNA(Gln) amidotransferase subunit A